MKGLAVVIAAALYGGCAWADADVPQSFSGKAAYYSIQGRVAAGGGFDPEALTAAHRTLPFGTRVRVTDPSTGRSVIVTVNDRGPFGPGRVIDLSLAAARTLDMVGRGVIFVTVQILER